MSLIAKSLSYYPPSVIRWAAGGWTFFIVENAILSENRTWLIDSIGDDNYHSLYGTCSTIATISIGYAYYKISRKIPPIPQMVRFRTENSVPPIAAGIGAWLSMSVGLVMASQVAPTFQIPVSVSTGHDNSSDNNNNNQKWKFQVRCPFDFADTRSETSSDNNIRGLERISRHPSLWCFGLFGMSQSFVAPTIPLQIWWLGPAFVAWLGGDHTDSRFRRGIGGTLSPEYECQTSNVPFLAMISGKQSCGWEGLGKEIKPLNAALGVVASSIWILQRMR